MFFVEYVSQLWLLLAAVALVGVSVFGLFASVLMLVASRDISELRIVTGVIRASTSFGQLLGALLFSMLFVNFVHDLVLMVVGGLSAE